jgi:hypothetical protein
VSIATGAVLAIDPRDPVGAELAVAELLDEGVSVRQAHEALARAIEEAAREKEVLVGISWLDTASLVKVVARIAPSNAWATTFAAPLPDGFVRLVMISEGRLTFSLVPQGQL